MKGFTLLELLIALAVFTVIAVAAYSGLDSVLFTHDAVKQEAERLAKVQMAWYMLARDVEQATPRGVRDEYGQPRPALESNELRGELLVLTRTGWDNPNLQRRASLQRLAYRLDGGALLRSYWTTLDRGPLNEPHETVLLDAVRELRVRFLNQNDEWQADWPPPEDSQQSVLPRAVEVTLILEDWGEVTRLFRLSDS